MSDDIEMLDAPTGELHLSKDRKVSPRGIYQHSRSRWVPTVANSFGLPAGLSCPGKTEFCVSCYGARAEQYQGVEEALDRNLRLLLDAGTVDGMTVLLARMMERFKRDADRLELAGRDRIFRIHWDGDFFSIDYAAAWARVIAACPDIQFWAYTRSFTDPVNVVPTLAGVDNLNLYLSVDAANIDAAAPVLADWPGVHLAGCAVDYRHAREYAPDAVICPENAGRMPLMEDGRGACVDCGVCPEGRRDVLFSTSHRLDAVAVTIGRTRGGPVQQPEPPRKLAAFPAGGIAPQPIELLWRNRFPIGTLSIVAGKPGLGKSTLETGIAAELSREGHTILISNIEDDPATVVRPRLDVANADLDRVLVMGGEDAPLLPRDFDALAELVADSGARCVIIDPIAAHFRPERRVHDRACTTRLQQIARDTGCAIIGIHHTVKQSVDGTALSYIGGPTGGLAGAARAVYLYGYDPADEDRRALVCVKANGFEEAAALIVEHDTVEYSTGEALIEAGLLRFIEETAIDGRDVMHQGRRRPDRDGEALEWLTGYLAGSDEFQQQSKDVRADAAARGLAWATVRRAGVALSVEHVRVGWGGDGFWVWRLPTDHPARDGVPIS